ncbi:MAG TPA: energy-coupling factor ABC transporter permease, partial [Thermoanaerobaculaceae bacterium]|nr:energy-coupling factor ABC transporter permease [Thermoanaerobaculaceae bacterium]
PVVGGTSGHLVGAVLVAALLGPSVAVVVMSAVLIVQCLMFADGGISALGANILNMGILGGAGGWVIYHVVSRAIKGLRGRLLAAGFAAWCTTVLAAVACAGELAVSRTVAFSVALPAMAGIHMLIGLGEALITALVLGAIARARPDLLEPEIDLKPARSYRALAAYGVLIVLGLALFVSPLASKWPDGLDRTAEVLGFKEKAAASAVRAPIPEYEMPGIGSSVVATSVAGALGTLVALALAWGLARVLVPKARGSAPAEPDEGS